MLSTTTANDFSGATASSTTTTTFFDLHADIIESHILPRLDGPSLASAACCSTTLRRLSAEHDLWSNLCHSTWPSTTTSPLLHRIISDEPHQFFSLASNNNIPSSSSSSSSTIIQPSELFSAVDIFYQDNLIFSRVQEIETVSSWFKCSPFRIDMVDPKDIITTNIESIASNDDKNVEVFEKNMTLSWLLIDPKERHVINLSSQQPVSVQRHWLTGDIELKYALILSHVQCKVVVTCGANNNGPHEKNVVLVREVSLEMEDIDGRHLNGRDSLGILQEALRGKMGRGGKDRAETCKKRYEEYLEEKREKRERKLRTEGVLDMLSVAVLVFSFAASVGYYVLWR